MEPWLVTWGALPVSYVQEEDGSTVQKRCPGRGCSAVPPAEHLAAVSLANRMGGAF